MTVRRFPVRLSAQYSVLVTLLTVGCAQQPQTGGPAQTASAVAPKPGITTEPGITIQSGIAILPSQPTESAVFEYPADLGGRAVASAVAPDRPALPAPARFVTAPRPRSLPTRLIDPEDVTSVSYKLSPILPAKPVAIQLVTPPERVPNDLGNGAGQVPAKPKLPVAAPITERSRDVNLPPPLPTLGKPLAERVSLDDPTAELGNVAIANPVVKVPLAPAPFLKLTVSDPFELGEQVKPKVAPAAEPGLAPVPVNPRRVK